MRGVLAFSFPILMFTQKKNLSVFGFMLKVNSGAGAHAAHFGAQSYLTYTILWGGSAKNKQVNRFD